MKIWGCSHVEPEHDPKQEIEKRVIDFILAGQAYFQCPDQLTGQENWQEQNIVEMKFAGYLKSGFVQHPEKRPHAVATIVMRHLVLKAPQAGEGRDSKQDNSAGAQNSINFGYRRLIVIDMLNNVGGNNQIDGLVGKRQRPDVTRSHVSQALFRTPARRILARIYSGHVRETYLFQQAQIGAGSCAYVHHSRVSTQLAFPNKLSKQTPPFDKPPMRRFDFCFRRECRLIQDLMPPLQSGLQSILQANPHP